MAGPDARLFPVVLVTITGDPAQEHYERLFDELERAVPKGKPYVTITDVRHLERAANAAQRKWMAERTALLHTRLGVEPIASFVVLESVLIRGALTAISWVMRGAQTPVATLPDAFERARAALVRAGLSVPAALEGAPQG